MNNIVNIKDVTVTYRGHVALENISLNIVEKTFMVVLGPNGAGKTTLLTVINGLGRILSGSVNVFGLPLSGRKMNGIRKRIGYVPQNMNVDPRFPVSVREVVAMGRVGKLGMFRSPGRKDEEIISSVMEMVGISGLADRPIGHLSGGERQKVMIANTLARQPEIILLDEPTSNLDPRAQGELIGLINRIYEESKVTMVFVTHLLHHIPRNCREVVLMKAGKIIKAGKVEDTLDEKSISELYNCPIKMTQKGERISIWPEWW